jgi:hypothetical protein
MRQLRLFFILSLIVSGGCENVSVEYDPGTTPRNMPTPLALRDVVPLPIERSGKGLSGAMAAGPWTVADVSKGKWKHTCSHQWLGFDTVGKQSYAFTLSPQQNPLRGACEIEKGAHFGRWSDEPNSLATYSHLDCTFHGASEGDLHLADIHSQGRREGRVTFGTVAWKLRSVHAEGSSASTHRPLGYEIVRDGYTVIAAVETIGKHRLWMDPTLSEDDQQRAVAIAGALLLYDPPDGFQEQDCK